MEEVEELTTDTVSVQEASVVEVVEESITDHQLDQEVQDRA